MSKLPTTTNSDTTGISLSKVPENPAELGEEIRNKVLSQPLSDEIKWGLKSFISGVLQTWYQIGKIWNLPEEILVLQLDFDGIAIVFDKLSFNEWMLENFKDYRAGSSVW